MSERLDPVNRAVVIPGLAYPGRHFSRPFALLPPPAASAVTCGAAYGYNGTLYSTRSATRPPKDRPWLPEPQAQLPWPRRPVSVSRYSRHARIRSEWPETGGRVSIAGVVCYRPGDRPRLFYQLRVCRRRKGEPKGFT